MALPRATGASRVPGPRVARTRTPETPAARPAPTPAARNLEDRLRHRQRCFGTLRASWRVKNFFSAWRSLVQMQNEALRVQQDHEAQLRAILDLRELLAQKELEVRQLSLLLATSRRKRSTLEHGIHIIQTGASDLVICLRVLGAWRRLSREGRLTDALRRVEADAQQREANLERELMLQLEEATATIRRLEGELRSSERRHRVLSEEIASLQRLLDEAELQQRKARQQRAARSERLAAGRSELEAKAVAWALWLRAIALLRCERHELQVMEHELALKDAAERHRLEVQEWERRLQERLAEIEALGQQRDQELRGSQDVFDLELARVHQAHADDRKTREEEHRLQAERHQLALEELQRQQFEAKQKLLMSSLAALNGQRAEGLRRDYFLAWAQYLVHVRRIRSQEWKEQELQRLQAQHDALHGKLQEREAAFARHRTNRGDQVATTKQKLWISQVLGAWLLVAVAMRLARARELEASEADRLRAELQRLSLESGRALRSQAGETLELRRRQALLLQILRSWLRIVWQQHLQARQSETAEVSRRLGGRNSRKDLQTDRLGQQLLLQASSVLLASAFHAWSKTAGLLRLDRAAQKMISKMDFLRRSGQSRRDQLLGKSEYLGQVCLARLVLAVWAQEARGGQLEKQRRSWSSELRRRADRGSNCGSRLAGKFWTLKMRLLLFATFMTWSRSAAALAAERLTERLRVPRGPGRVVSVVSAIEERRARILALEAFQRWKHSARKEKASSSPSRSPVITRVRSPVLRPAYQIVEPISSPPPVVQAARCPACGNVYMTDSVYCRKCGRKRDILSPDLSRPFSVTLPATLPTTAPPPPPPMPVRAGAPGSPVSAALPVEVSSPRAGASPPFVAASPTEGLPLQTPDVCHFLRADLNAVPALPQRTEEVRPGRGRGHSPMHSRGRCDNFMVTMPRQDPQRMTSPETSPIRLGGLRLGEVQPMVATEPITSPTHLAAQGQWDPSCMGPTVWQVPRR